MRQYEMRQNQIPPQKLKHFNHMLEKAYEEVNLMESDHYNYMQIYIN